MLEGERTTYIYDNTGHVTEREDALGNRTTYTYDAVYNRRTLENARGAVTTTNYDNVGRVLSRSDPYEKLTSYTATMLQGTVLSKKDARNNLWTYVYDELNRQEAVQTPRIQEFTTSTFDQVGNVLGVLNIRNVW